MDKAIADSVAEQFRSAFPEGTFTQVYVLGYGDDPDVEPGETAIRAFIDRGGHPAGTWEDDETVMQTFEQANRQAITWLHRDGQLSSIAWDPGHSGYSSQAGSRRRSVGLPELFLQHAL